MSAGGGDGTISCAGALAWKSGKLLGIIPAGTMNLYARSLSIPLDIWDAASALAAGTAGQSDIATANGHPFLHQISVGFHPRMVRSRSRYKYASKLGKIGASILSAIDTIRRPPVFPVIIDCDGEITEREVSAISVSNNPYGEGHLPFADNISGGRLGIYISGPLDTPASARALADLLLGQWQANPDIEQRTARRVTLEFPKPRPRSNCVIDGELAKLQRSVEIEIHPGGLNVLQPAVA